MLKTKLWLALLWGTLQLLVFETNAQTTPNPGSDTLNVQAPKPALDAVKPSTSSPTFVNSPPLLETKCVLVRNTGVFWGGYAKSSDDMKKPLGTGQTQTSQNTPCIAFGPSDKTLIGTGDVIIGIEKAAFESAQKSKHDISGEFILFLNGVALPKDASLLVLEEVNSFIFLRFRIHQGPEIQKLWSILYADGALFKPQNLNAALGWHSTAGDEINLIPARSNQTAEISLTTELRFFLAILLMLLTVGVITWIGRRTDVLRDVPDSQIPQWWEDAGKLKSILNGLKDQQARETYLSTQNLNYDAQLNPSYDRFANLALQGNPIKDMDIVATINPATKYICHAA